MARFTPPVTALGASLQRRRAGNRFEEVMRRTGLPVAVLRRLETTNAVPDAAQAAALATYLELPQEEVQRLAGERAPLPVRWALDL